MIKKVGRKYTGLKQTNKYKDFFFRFFDFFEFFLKVPIVKAIQIDLQTHLLHLHICQKEGL